VYTDNISSDAELLTPPDPGKAASILAGLVPVGDADLEKRIRIWPELNRATMPGIVGEFIDLATEGSEADPAAVLLTFMTAMGCFIGAAPYVPIGAGRQTCRLFSLLVGASSKARKGTSAEPVKLLISMLRKQYSPLAGMNVSPGPIGSGEGLIFAVRDAGEKKKKDSDEPEDAGVEDKRLLVFESEFVNVINACKREGSTASGTIRNAWDSGDLEPLTKRERIKTTGAHISIVGHITEDELRSKHDKADISNGFFNRFLFGCVRRTCLQPFPPVLNEQTPGLQNIVDRLGHALIKALKMGEVLLHQDSRPVWTRLYKKYGNDVADGAFGSVTSRAEAQVLRIALIYALLDLSAYIMPAHLEAAEALWDYSESSARYLFSEVVEEGDSIQQRILSFLETGPKKQTEIYELFNRNVKASDYLAALKSLQSVGRITQQLANQTKGAGRPAVIWGLSRNGERG
jgi:hypothetical protein